ncbi:MAG TPA: hypothetical protein VMW83_02385, partial [Spirochaetia bacterium]|nr:hypothetical protein [Spirochaetia bacterium]
RKGGVAAGSPGWCPGIQEPVQPTGSGKPGWQPRCRIPRLRPCQWMDALHLGGGRIHDPDPSGPFGAKGISEVATVPVTPAILNANYDATGVRIRTLPATPSKILAGLQRN